MRFQTILVILAFLVVTCFESQAQSSSNSGIQPVQTMPAYPGGQEAMYKHIQDHLKIPVGYKSKSKTVQVIVKFRVDQSGKVGDVTVVQSVDAALDNAAINVISSMPAWQPGMKEGKPVEAYLTLPVSFTFKD